MSRPLPFLQTHPMALATGLLISIATAPAAATILTFDQVRSAGGAVVPTVSGQNLPPDYGDRVTAGVVDVPGGQFTYSEAGEGYTPNVSTMLFSGAASPVGPGTSLWRDGYGDLGNVLIANNASDFLAVRLTADPGFQVGLFGFDLAGWPNADYVIEGISVAGAAGLLYSLADVRVEGDFDGPRHTAFAFDAGLFADELLLTIAFGNLGASRHDNIGLDNLRFGQTPPATPTPGGGGGGSGPHDVPEPGTLPLLGAGLIAAWRMRQRSPHGRARARHATRPVKVPAIWRGIRMFDTGVLR